MISDLIDLADIGQEDLNSLFSLCKKIKKNPGKYSRICRGKVMATLFYEPSTRTQFSHQAAMLKLGGSVIGFSDPGRSSVAKGETLVDTVKMMAMYSDVTVIRHPMEGTAYAASLFSEVPVINAGDGGHLHPTQTLADLYTIKEKFGRFTGLTIGACGDLLNGRTVHSLIRSMAKHSGNTYYFISTEELSLPAEFITLLESNNNRVYIVRDLELCIPELDVLYMTRIQKERFNSVAEYELQSGRYILDREKLARAKQDMIILHPLPKVDEIEYEVDNDERAYYFRQAENGLYMRMTLIISMLKTAGKKTLSNYPAPKSRVCGNPLCITAQERYLPALTKTRGGAEVCVFCEKNINK